MSTAHIADPPVPKRAYPTRKRNEERFDPDAVFFAIRVGFRVKRRGEEMRDSKRAAFARRFRA
jgi:hypothetical protein